MKATDKAYDVFVANFEQNEENFRNGEGSQLERDLWYTQYQYLKRSKETVDALNELKEVLFLTKAVNDLTTLLQEANANKPA